MFYTIRRIKNSREKEGKRQSHSTGKGKFPNNTWKGTGNKRGRPATVWSAGDCHGGDVMCSQINPLFNTWPQAAAFPFCLTLVWIPLISTWQRPLLQCCRSVVQTPLVIAKETEISFLGIVELAFSLKKTKKFHFGKWWKQKVFPSRQIRGFIQELQKKCRSLGCSDLA